MTFSRIAPRAIAVALAVAVTVTLLASSRGNGEVSAPPSLPTVDVVPRTGGDLTAYQGMGVWVDIYDPSWAHPREAVRRMAARGVRTLYLETSNYNRPSPFV